MASQLPAVGDRLSHSGSLGTVRFLGSVQGTQGLWLGIEWDDPSRGKHDGVKDGKRYFSCFVPNSGSFIRPSAAISYGVSFLSALTAKYIEARHGGASSEKVILGSSGGAIEVEAVGLDRIRNNLSRLEMLREVSLDGETVSKANIPGEIGRTCPGIRGLDLSKNLIPSWNVVAAITSELHNLRSLRLNQNRLGPPDTLRSDVSAFQRLEELQLNATLTTWDEFQALLPHMPALRTVELGYNRLQALSPHSRSQATWSTNAALSDVNLDGNELNSFVDISSAVSNLTALQRLVLTSNLVSRICEPPPSVPSHISLTGTDETLQPPPPPPLSLLRGLKHLALAFNRIGEWHDIDMLQRWCPDLESLTLAGNPIFDDPGHASYARAFTIAKIPSLRSLDGAAISPRERTDSELLYLTYISKQAFASEDEKCAAHPQWQRLTAKHGATEEPPTNKSQDTLSNRLINIRIYRRVTAPPSALAGEALANYLQQCKSDLSLRVLSTMTTQQSTVRLWMVLSGGRFVELDKEYYIRDLAYWGIEENTQFILVDSN